jgi:lipoprotein-anchoring transpeptidase ErfK/SrfK
MLPLRAFALSASILAFGATGALAQDLPFPFNLFQGLSSSAQPAQQAMPSTFGQTATAVEAQPTKALVDDPTGAPKGWITVNTQTKFLYLSLGDGKAWRYGVGVGREGFGWTGHVHIAKMAQWPDWTPPPEMLKRRPDLPTFMAGGIGNPLGARAMYLFNTTGDSGFRIHGTNEPDTIGQAVSSGCIRMLNVDVEDLYTRVKVGTQVNVI